VPPVTEPAWEVLEAPWAVLEIAWAVLEIAWAVLEAPQPKPLPHELAASTRWFFSMGFEANNNAAAIATKAKTDIFLTVVFMLPTMQRYSLYEVGLTWL
jgi:hypothetical protein